MRPTPQYDYDPIFIRCQAFSCLIATIFVVCFPLFRVIVDFSSPFPMQCLRIIKRTGARCQHPAHLGKDFCNSCERWAPKARGLDNANTRGKGRTSHLPPGAFERCQTMLSLPDLYDLTAEIATLQTLFTQAQESMAHGEPFERWARFEELLATIDRTARKTDNLSVMQFNTAMIASRGLARQCRNDFKARQEIKQLAKLLGEMQEKQAKTEQLHNELVPMNKVRALFMAMLTSIYDGIPDEGAELRVTLARNVRRLFNRPEIPVHYRKKHEAAIARFAEEGNVIDVVPNEGVSYLEEGHFDTDSKELSESTENDDLSDIFDLFGEVETIVSEAFEIADAEINELAAQTGDNADPGHSPLIRVG